MTIDTVLTALRAAAEPTRLRLLALCAEAELTVSELVHILRQSQPRVSRHLKLLCDAGLIERCREGSWVYYRLADDEQGGDRAGLARALVRLLPDGDPQAIADRQRLATVRASREQAAADYFRANAGKWNAIRSLYVDGTEVERVLDGLLPGGAPGTLLDIGTGTGRILERFGARFDRALGIDLSHEMLTIARATLARAGLDHCRVQRADMYDLPLADRSFDAVVCHLVLHYAEDPAAVIAEAARVLKPGGALVIVDFGPHRVDALQREHAHRRLGFSDGEIAGWLAAAELDPAPPLRLEGEPLTVVLWKAVRRAIAPLAGHVASEHARVTS